MWLGSDSAGSIPVRLFVKNDTDGDLPHYPPPAIPRAADPVRHALAFGSSRCQPDRYVLRTQYLIMRLGLLTP